MCGDLYSMPQLCQGNVGAGVQSVKVLLGAALSDYAERPCTASLKRRWGSFRCSDKTIIPYPSLSQCTGHVISINEGSDSTAQGSCLWDGCAGVQMAYAAAPFRYVSAVSHGRRRWHH